MKKKEPWIFALTPTSKQKGGRPQFWAWSSFEYEPKPTVPEIGMIIPGLAHGDLDVPETAMEVIGVLDAEEALDFLDRMHQVSELLSCHDSFMEDVHMFAEHCALTILKSRK